MSKTKPSAGIREPVVNLMGMIRNEVILRSTMLRKWLDPRRDIDKECGYPETIELETYRRMFDRKDLSTRVVTVFPEETWASDPIVYENDGEILTEFEKAWNTLNKRLAIFSFLQRVDVLSGIGRFGVLLLGFDDGLTLDKPVPGDEVLLSDDETATSGKAHKLLYLRAFDETVVKISRLESEVTNPRFGLPVEYEIDFADTEQALSSERVQVAKQKVHWSRIIHVADNRTNSEIFGEPRMKNVFDRLLDLQKVSGGASEMFWKGGFPGLALESMVDPEKASVEFDEEATKAQMDSYMNGLQRYIAVTGMQVKNLGTQVADPRPHVEAIVRMIAVTKGVPWRILMGVEVGHLAAEQDIRAWNRRLERRRDQYIDPFLLRPFIRRLIAFGVLPVPEEVLIYWPDLNTLSDKDKAEVAEKKTNSMIKYVQGGVNLLMPPFHYLTLILGLTDEEANQVIKAAGGDLEKLSDLIMPGPEPGNQPDQSATKGAMQPPRRRGISAPNSSRNGA